jgi:hypothetical protein
MRIQHGGDPRAKRWGGMQPWSLYVTRRAKNPDVPRLRPIRQPADAVQLVQMTMTSMTTGLSSLKETCTKPFLVWDKGERTVREPPIPVWDELRPNWRIGCGRLADIVGDNRLTTRTSRTAAAQSDDPPERCLRH